MATKINRRVSIVPNADGPSALRDAERVLNEFDRVHGILTETSAAIPRLLSARMCATSAASAAEIDGAGAAIAHTHADEIERERESAVRRRQGAINSLIASEETLRTCQTAVSAELNSRAEESVREWRARYDAAVRKVQELWLEGDQLSSTLRTRVEMPLPCRITSSAADLMPRLTRVMPSDLAPARLNDRCAELGELMARLESALQSILAIRTMQARERNFATIDVRKGFLPDGIYRVARPFNGFDGVRFESDMLVDASVLGPVTLYRLTSNRTIVLASAAA